MTHFLLVPIGYWMAVVLGAVGTGLLSVTFPTLVAISYEYSGRSRATGIGLIGVGTSPEVLPGQQWQEHCWPEWDLGE